jgi:hypothetical protein
LISSLEFDNGLGLFREGFLIGSTVSSSYILDRTGLIGGVRGKWDVIGYSRGIDRSLIMKRIRTIDKDGNTIARPENEGRDKFVIYSRAPLVVAKEHERFLRGRYDPEEYCPKMLQLFEMGMGEAEVASELGISLSTMGAWVARYPEFGEAYELGLQLAKAWWERQGRLGLYSREFNHNLWMHYMTNRYGWSRKMDIRGAPGSIPGNLPEPKMLDSGENAENERRIAAVLDVLIEAGAVEAGTEETPDPEMD